MAQINKCLDLQSKARELIPGMTQLLSKRPDMFSLGVWPAYYKKANGVEVWDLDGNRYVDMSISGIGANVLGYADPDVDGAVEISIKNGSSCSLNCAEEVELAELLCDLHPWADMVRFARSGGESMAIAVRIARAYSGKDKIAFCGYHGWHDWYLAANLSSDDALGNHLISGLSVDGVPRGLAGSAFPFRYNRLDELQKIVEDHGRELGVIIIESIRNSEPGKGFIEGVRDIADGIGAVLVVDEISAGFRVNTGGAHLVYHSVDPDIAVFAKAMGNGYPIGAVIGKAAVMSAAQKTFISSTNWTERIGPTAAIATIKKHRDNHVGEHLLRIGRQVQSGWREMAVKNGLSVNVGGLPPLSHFSFNHPNRQAMKAYFIQQMLEKGFLASNLFYAMYAHQEEHVRSYLEAVDESMSCISNAINSGDIEGCLRGFPSSEGFQRLT